ncbi:type II toxin-antitoxin system Phd/YefM family antitoxin [Agrococcus baldri]|uniref:Antitoxin n=1 Tax=Agrococcus baldri TaxID=153730 RepID=A0AA87URM6_9MICO|nr:type II toxin-antitoxin system prevent-host-death family antitoxin [Agrococcus baldri]GEK79709.1 antitoxin [Agrococcus baldri]
MKQIGIRALKQNASAVAAEAAAGESMLITDRGRPVAQITPIPESALERLRRQGRVRDARGSLEALPEPSAEGDLSGELARMREAERF